MLLSSVYYNKWGETRLKIIHSLFVNWVTVQYLNTACCASVCFDLYTQTSRPKNSVCSPCVLYLLYHTVCVQRIYQLLSVIRLLSITSLHDNYIPVCKCKSFLSFRPSLSFLCTITLLRTYVHSLSLIRHNVWTLTVRNMDIENDSGFNMRNWVHWLWSLFILIICRWIVMFAAFYCSCSCNVSWCGFFHLTVSSYSTAWTCMVSVVVVFV